MKSVPRSLACTCRSSDNHESTTIVERTKSGSENHPELRILAKEGLRRIPARGLYTEEARLERLAYLRKETGTALSEMGKCNLQADRLTGNIENLIGSIEIPVGIAGPLVIHGEKADGAFYLPMATSEGALVASATRGATAISRSGGVTARVLRQQMLRVPLFVLSNMKEALLFADIIRTHVEELQTRVNQVSSHAKLTQVDPILIGNQVHVRFVYETGDASGQNMTTTSTWHACQWLMEYMQKHHSIGFENFLIEGNMSGDKKVGFQSFIAGRGTRVSAEAFISTEDLMRVLKVTPEQMASCHHLGMVGACQSGTIGYNINTANVIAASFAATGQDIACVHESSVAQFHVQSMEGGLYASMVLPSLVVGTVGGGTALPRQQQMLEMMGCAGTGKVSRFAEIIAGFCLALDLSTMSAIISGQFASAHERLGRNKPVQWFLAEDINADFLTTGLQQYFADESLLVERVEPLASFKMGSSIITELTARKLDKFVGFLPLSLGYHSEGNTPDQSSLNVVVKVKPLDKEVILMANSMAGMCGTGLRETHECWKHKTGLADCHLRELAIYNQTDPRLVRHIPAIYQTWQNSDREAYVIVMEQLDDVLLMDTADDVSGWGATHIDAALEGIAKVHSIWYGHTEELESEPWIGSVPTAVSMVEMSDLWQQLGFHAAQEFPEWIIGRDVEWHRRLVRRLGRWWSEIDSMPKTLIHNDFNPRNICLRESDDAQDSFGYRLCAYDWELATIHLPQHDLAELLCFVLTPDTPKSVVDHHVEVHRRALEKASSQAIDAEQWRRGFNLSLCDLAVNRFMLYLVAHTFRHYPFMQRISRTLRHLIQMESGREVIPR
jgi:hydroxymethylglutaryl-CoA reductase (NADPH)